MRTEYEKDEEAFPSEAYRVKEKWARGSAFRVLGWEIERYWDIDEGIYPDDPDERRTGKVVVRMVGDDHRFTVELDDLEPLPEEDFCGECGQIGCGHGQ